MAADTAHAAGLGLLRRAAGLEQRLVVLMGARLALALISLGIGLAVDTTVGDVGEPGRRGLYATVSFAFLATAFTGVLMPRIRRPRRFATINIATDIAIVSALVHFSGGPDSVFSFLYVLVAVYGALLFDRRGAYSTAGLGMLTYGAVLLAAQAGWGVGAPSAHPAPVLLTVWAIHAGAMALSAGLASFLAAELHRAGEALEQRTSDLRTLENLHRRTVESLMSGLLTTDREGRITSFNPEAERITGVAAAAALGADVEQVLPGLRDGVLAEAKETGGPRARMAYRSRRGENLHLGLAAYVLRDEDGESSGQVLIFQDVTEVVQMEAELRRSERLAAAGKLSASIAHEIRNPLAAISGCIQLLRREGGARSRGVEARRLMDIVLRETDRLNTLITDFLCYARPGPTKLEPVALASVVDDLLQMLGAAAPEGVAVSVDVGEGLAVLADADQLRQVLWNLAVNAIQAMPEGGSLMLEASPTAEAPTSQEPRSGRRNGVLEAGAWVEVAVRDEGVGVAAEDLDHIFDPFFTTKSEGSGLGLATVHRIVAEHGGAIRLESTVGKGTTVRLLLPRAEGSA